MVAAITAISIIVISVVVVVVVTASSSSSSAAAAVQQYLPRQGAMTQGLSQHGKPMAHHTEVMTRQWEKASFDSPLQGVPLTQSGASPVNTTIRRHVRYHHYRCKSDSSPVSPATSENHPHPSRQIPPHTEKPKHASDCSRRTTLPGLVP